ncbi:pyrroline-5-carboxylate reductase [Alkalicoccus urumqiensis]|uniref:Pyrroline-5-carboxylate reductase n=1 Tax=Alkalicoccus urumqiensis TaxID=1548213 RepID=A0A2P6MKD6_ALKUR|nr:pyrroline-5-carboxylate reductase [Alkalicoccus urumqiensis]PRO66747.1 pyrroline-5-carboxylate reductase [Alkalicoccus urumqiensis]
MKITFIGAGSMAEAMIAGWSQLKEPPEITVTNRSDDEKLERLEKTYGIHTSRSMSALVDADFIFAACKPKDWEEAVYPFLQSASSSTVFVSVMAGITLDSLKQLDPSKSWARSMPNTSAAVQASMTSISFDKTVPDSKKTDLLHLLKEIGETAVIEESIMDAVTALTGTGPAYIYYLMESMEKAAANIGIPESIGRNLVAQTLIGASRRVQAEEKTPKELYTQIMSPGGTTEAGFHVLQDRGVQEALIACITRAHERAGELGARQPAEKTD